MRSPQWNRSRMSKKTPAGSVGGRSREKEEETGRFLQNDRGGSSQWLF